MPGQLSFALSGNFMGFTRPCGCMTEQDGGLPRLASAMDYLRRRVASDTLVEPPKGAVAEPPPGLDATAPTLLIECGNFADPRARAPGPRAKAHLAALGQIGCGAAVIGTQELMLSAEDAAFALGGSPVALCSANLTSSAEAVKVSPSVEAAPGCFIIGVTMPPPSSAASTEQVSGGAVVSDPLEGVRGALSALPEGSRAFVACANMPPGLTRQIAALNIAGRTLIGVTGITGADESAAVPIVGQPERRAERLAIVSFLNLEDGVEAKRWELRMDSSWPSDEQVLATIKAGEDSQMQAVRADPGDWRKVDWGRKGGLTEAEARGLTAAASEPPLELRYIGSDKCVDCHPKEAAVWEKSRHRQSYKSLLDHGEAQTFDCLECHSTGFLRPGGYDPAKSFDVLRDPLASVGCEDCHGPGALHIDLAGKGKWQAEDVPRGHLGIARGELNACTRCHDSYNSPSFDAPSFWERIRH
jgi:Cytochrome c554 and c-prime